MKNEDLYFEKLETYSDQCQELEERIRKIENDNEMRRTALLEAYDIESEDFVKLAEKRGITVDEAYAGYMASEIEFEELEEIAKSRPELPRDSHFLSEHFGDVLVLQAEKCEELGRSVSLDEVGEKVMSGEWRLNLPDSKPLDDKPEDKKNPKLTRYLDELLVESVNEEEKEILTEIRRRVR